MVVAALAGGMGSSAMASELSPADIMAMPKAQYQRYLKAKRSNTAAVARAPRLDTIGPVITKLDLVPTLDVSDAGGGLVYSYAAADDLSGVRWLGIVLVGPSDQEVTTYTEVGMPRLKVSGTGGTYPGPWTEAGEWRVTEVRGQDYANNDFQIPVDLDALGNMKLRIQNPRPSDSATPMLVSGKVLTPSVSLAVPPKGLDYGSPLVGISVTLKDAGAAPSGINGVYVEYCQFDDNGCFYMDARTNNVRSVKQVTLQPFTQTDDVTNLPGTYQLRSLSINDHAGNQRTLTSILFGGETDFSKFFASTTIELRP